MANMAFCSDGERVSQATIDRRLSQSYRDKYETNSGTIICECCGKEPSVHNDHTIAQRRCKILHKTELIWNPENYVRSCERCHKQWEAFKAGDWCLHNNVGERLYFLKLHDREGYNIRITMTTANLEDNESSNEERTD